MKKLIRFLKDWTLPVSIAVGGACYLLFCCVPQLDALGDRLGEVVDAVFPWMVFSTLFSTFCRIDFHQMRPHRWHIGIIATQLVLVALVVAVILWLDTQTPTPITQHLSPNTHKLLWEALLTCIIGPAATAAPVVTAKIGGNINTMTAFVVLSSFVCALTIPAVFPLIERGAGLDFWSAFFIILQKLSMVLILPLVLGWCMQHFAKRLCAWIVSIPDLSFYLWAAQLSVTSGVTVRNIVHSQGSLSLLLMIALLSLVLCFVLFVIGRAVGSRLGDEVNGGQASFQKNTALSIWVAYTYLNPLSSVGAGCYVLWQNIINSIELWLYRRQHG